MTKSQKQPAEEAQIVGTRREGAKGHSYEAFWRLSLDPKKPENSHPRLAFSATFAQLSLSSSSTKNQKMMPSHHDFIVSTRVFSTSASCMSKGW